MATRVELPKDIVEAAFVKSLQSAERAMKAATNKLIQNAIKDEITQIRAATATMTETK